MGGFWDFFPKEEKETTTAKVYYSFKLVLVFQKIRDLNPSPQNTPLGWDFLLFFFQKP